MGVSGKNEVYSIVPWIDWHVAQQYRRLFLRYVHPAQDGCRMVPVSPVVHTYYLNSSERNLLILQYAYSEIVQCLLGNLTRLRITRGLPI